MEHQIVTLSFPPPPPKKPLPEDAIDAETRQALQNYALLYTATQRGTQKTNSTQIRFMMSVEDARKFCESDLSEGKMYGSQWCYCWTSVWNFLYKAWTAGQGIVIDSMADNGSYDSKIENLGCKKYGARDMYEILSKLGVQITIRGSKQRLINNGLVSEREFAETEQTLLKRKKGKK